jgi:biotin-(acetyl-CoA carboxylase) ligase
VNLTLDIFDKAGIRDSATSLKIETNRTWKIDTVRQWIQNAIRNTLEAVMMQGSSYIQTAWQKADWLDGSQVRVVSQKDLYGQYRGLDEWGRLILVDEAGKEHCFSTGDVQKVISLSSDSEF